MLPPEANIQIMARLSAEQAGFAKACQCGGPARGVIARTPTILLFIVQNGFGVRSNRFERAEPN